MQLNEGKFARAVDGDEQVQLALFGADLRDVDVEVTDRYAVDRERLDLSLSTSGRRLMP
jgi:hypothetical protein